MEAWCGCLLGCQYRKSPPHHQPHVTLVPDTLVFTASADEHRPLQKCLSSVKEEVFVLPSLLGNCPQRELSGSTPHWKHRPVYNRCLFYIDFAVLGVEHKNTILLQDIVHMRLFAVKVLVCGLYQQLKLSSCLKYVTDCSVWHFTIKAALAWLHFFFFFFYFRFDLNCLSMQ